MAESIEKKWTTNILCRYFLRGHCLRGSECYYSHDSTAEPDFVHKYTLGGPCTYGEKCRSDHIKPNNASSIKKPAAQMCNPPKKNQMSGSNHWSSPSSSAAAGLVRCENSPASHMVTLKKGQDVMSASQSKTPVSSGLKSIEEWVQAAEFTPGKPWKGTGPVSYLDAAQSGLEASRVTDHSDNSPASQSTEDPKQQLCPYAAQGDCPYADRCIYVHGDICDICGKMVLEPGNEMQNRTHKKECLSILEEDMELSFAFQRSKDKVCGICMETIMEKKPSHEQRFGVLSNCNHVFCLNCIRTWRQAKSFENKIVRACPQCRVKSDFVTPSKYWVEDEAEKQKLIEGYKSALGKKPCKHFDQGRGECPFNEHCFYLHTYPDGRKASPKPVRRRQYQGGDGELELVQRLLLWDFLEPRASLSLDDDWEQVFLQLNLLDMSDSDTDSSHSLDSETLDMFTL